VPVPREVQEEVVAYAIEQCDKYPIVDELIVDPDRVSKTSKFMKHVEVIERR
jgi:hypothetical protein